MEPRKIKSELVLRGRTMQSIATEYGCSRSAVNQVITGKIKSRRLAEAVAAVIGLAPEQVFPDYYSNRD